MMATSVARHQTSLFADMPSRFQAWADFHLANPSVFILFRRFAIEALEAGRTRLSARMIGERIRWYTNIETTADSPAVNDHHWPYYARLLIGLDKRFESFFMIKEHGFDGTIDQIVAVELNRLRSLSTVPTRACDASPPRDNTRQPTRACAVNELPDAITCENTPLDNQGQPIAGGHRYLIHRPGSETAKVEVVEDSETGDLYFRPVAKQNARWQRVDQSDPSVTWRLVK
jgi:hypothetical protein